MKYVFCSSLTTDANYVCLPGGGRGLISRCQTWAPASAGDGVDCTTRLTERSGVAPRGTLKVASLFAALASPATRDEHVMGVSMLPPGMVGAAVTRNVTGALAPAARVGSVMLLGLSAAKSVGSCADSVTTTPVAAVLPSRLSTVSVTSSD